MEGFKIGDVVMLKSGGPKMTISNEGDLGSAGRGALCQWFVEGDIKERVFKYDSIMKISKINI